MLSEMQVSAYLDRIKWSGSVPCNERALDALVFAHQCNIPFETVSMRRAGCTPSLEVDDLFSKAVTQRLGGYCFELNKLFEELLRALGFDAQPRLARAVCGEDERMPINHRAVEVRIGGDRYLVDVGFGGPMPAGALLLEDGLVQVVRGDTFIPMKIGDAWWRIDRITRARADFFNDDVPARCQNELELCEAACEDIDFAALNLAQSQPGTEFRDQNLVNLRTETGHIALTDRKLTMHSNGSKNVMMLENEAAVDEALATYFGMRYE